MGEYGLNIHSLNSVDDKGRILLPIKLRDILQEVPLIITRGIEQCLWLFTDKEWQILKQTTLKNLSVFDPDSRIVQRRILAPAHEIGLDNVGRIKISPSLMQMAHLKKECYLIGLGSYMEIWDVNLYHAYENSTNERLENAFQRAGR